MSFETLRKLLYLQEILVPASLAELTPVCAHSNGGHIYDTMLTSATSVTGGRTMAAILRGRLYKVGLSSNEIGRVKKEKEVLLST